MSDSSIRTFSEKTLDLELSRTARAFEPDERIWEPELERIFHLIHQHTLALRLWQNRSKGESRRHHRRSAPVLSIPIFGTYGSGKSSLLYTLSREVNRSLDDWATSDLGSAREKLSRRVHSLPVLQPNYLSEDDHFLYAFLAAALEEDLRQHSAQEERLSAGSHNLSPVQQAFQRVSEFLQVLDKPTDQQEYDPLGLSLERLDRHTSSFRLQQELGRLIDTLAHNLAGTEENSVLLLPVDDADMSQDQLVKTLDTYRRYLTHPRLVPVFTFSGPVAEELLQVHFSEELSVKQRGKVTRSNEAQRLDLTETLSFQYLVKLFPIRNRVKLGFAPARIQAAKFKTIRRGSDEAASHEGQEIQYRVFDLLEASSRLLLGHPDPLVEPRIRTALRSSILRRQLQILDAMHDSGTIELIEPAGSTSIGEKIRKCIQAPWGRLFDRAAWSLLNVHRDVLRELDLHIENLYSWTPEGLQGEILKIVLMKTKTRRKELLKSWHYRLEDRRGQALSLLVATVFRPQMRQEEPSGDDPEILRNWGIYLEEKSKGKDLPPPEFPSPDSYPQFQGEPCHTFFPVQHGLVWFLRLWIGFYLPLIVTRKQVLSGDLDEQIDASFGTGWGLSSGPLHAMYWSRDQKSGESCGMLHLDAESFLNKCQTGDDSSRMYLSLWCYYGTEAGKAWGVLSFWRGLGLLGKILQDYQRRREEPGNWTQTKRKEFRHHLAYLLKVHCLAARRGGDEHGSPSSPSCRPGEDDESFKQLAEKLDDWLENQVTRLFLDPLLLGEPAREIRDLPDHEWKRCFIRRLQGDSLQSRFWPMMGGAYLAPGDDDEVVDVPGVGEGEEAADTPEGSEPGSSPWQTAETLAFWRKQLLHYFHHVPVVSGGTKSKRKKPSLTTLSAVLKACPLLSTPEIYAAFKNVGVYQPPQDGDSP